MTRLAMPEPIEQEESGIGIRHYLDVLRRRKWTVVGVVALALCGATIFTLRQPDEYRAETTIVVGQAGGLVQPQNAGAIQPFSATMKELITSTVVAQDVIQTLDLKTTPQGLLGDISVSFSPESAALKVSVVQSSPAVAKGIAQQIGIAFSQLVKERFGTVNPQSTAPLTAPLTATVWDPAHVIPGKVQPRPKLNLLIAGILGLVLGLLAAFLREQFDRTLRDTDEIEHAFGVPVIGQIPDYPKATGDRPRVIWNGSSDYAEAFRALRANLQYLGVARRLRTVLVTSPAAGQGKTTVCGNLATVLSHSGSSVVLVEADLRRPQLGHMFGIPAFNRGLTTVLVGEAEVSAVVERVGLPPAGMSGSKPGTISVLPSGPLPPNPSELVGSEQMQRVIADLAEDFDAVIVDSPPMLLVADSIELAKHVDGVIVVVRLQNATRDEARELRSIAARLDIPIVGVVVIGVRGRRDYGYLPYSSEPAAEAATEEETPSTRDGRRSRSRPTALPRSTEPVGRSRRSEG